MIDHKRIWIDVSHIINQFVLNIIQIVMFFKLMPYIRGRKTNNTSSKAPPTAHARPLAQLSRELCSHVTMPTPFHIVNHTSDCACPTPCPAESWVVFACVHAQHALSHRQPHLRPCPTPYINFPIKLNEWSLYFDAVCIAPFFFISKCGAIIQAC